MTNSINIQELTEKIANEIQNSSTKNTQNIDEKNFEKLIELEKLNKKIKQDTNDSKESNDYTSNIKDNLKEPILILILFIVLSHSSCTNLINKIPITCIKDNNIIQIIMKGFIMAILFFFTKNLLD